MPTDVHMSFRAEMLCEEILDCLQGKDSMHINWESMSHISYPFPCPFPWSVRGASLADRNESPEPASQNRLVLNRVEGFSLKNLLEELLPSRQKSFRIQKETVIEGAKFGRLLKCLLHWYALREIRPYLFLLFVGSST